MSGSSSVPLSGPASGDEASARRAWSPPDFGAEEDGPPEWAHAAERRPRSVLFTGAMLGALLLAGSLVLIWLVLTGLDEPIAQAPAPRVVESAAVQLREQEIQGARAEAERQIEPLRRQLAEQTRRAEAAELRATLAERNASTAIAALAQLRAEGPAAARPALAAPRTDPAAPSPRAGATVPEPSAPGTVLEAVPEPGPDAPQDLAPSAPAADPAAAPAPNQAPNPPPGPAAGAGRIVLHYPATARSEAEALAARLGPQGGEAELRVVAATPSLPLIRYYHAADRAAAQRLGDRLGSGWRVQDFTDFEPRPRPGLLEIWMPAP